MNIDFEAMAVLEEESQNVSPIFFVTLVYLCLKFAIIVIMSAAI